MQLASGRRAKPRSPTYIKLDLDIQQAKASLIRHLESIYPHPSNLGLIQLELSRYLQHVAYLFGI